MSAPLNSLATGSYYKLEWRQAGASSRDAELKMDDRAIGSLKFRSAFGTLATATVADTCWTFKRVGFFQQRVAIRECGSDRPVAEFRNATWSGGGTLQIDGGRKFQMTTNWWQSKWEVQDADGRMLLRFDYGGVFKLAAKIKIASEARGLQDLPLLVALSWYLVVMLNEDASAAAIIG